MLNALIREWSDAMTAKDTRCDREFLMHDRECEPTPIGGGMLLSTTSRQPCLSFCSLARSTDVLELVEPESIDVDKTPMLNGAPGPVASRAPLAGGIPTSQAPAPGFAANTLGFAACALKCVSDSGSGLRAETREMMLQPSATELLQDLFTTRPEASVAIAGCQAALCSPGVIPAGWCVLPEAPPQAFLAVGGAACIIKCESSDDFRVLLSLRSAAVDLQRAQWLMREGSHPKLLKMHRMVSRSDCDAEIFEFDLPRGQPLSHLLAESGPLEEPEARDLCRELLDLVAPKPGSLLRLWGLIDTSNVFVGFGGKGGQPRLRLLIPVGCLLSLSGARAIESLQAVRGGSAPPELVSAITAADASVAAIALGAGRAEAYASCALIWRAMIFPPARDDGEARATRTVSAHARSFLTSALSADPATRLSGPELLGHPWFQSAACELACSKDGTPALDLSLAVEDAGLWIAL